MTNTGNITIDGQQYDAATGLRVGGATEKAVPKAVSAPAISAKHTPAKQLHVSPQRSQTLRRSVLKKPATSHPLIQNHKPRVRSLDITPHPQVRKFAPHPVGAIKPQPRAMDIGPVVHPHVAKAHAKSAAKAAAAAAPLASTIPAAKDIKEHAVKSAVERTQKRQPLKSRLLPKQRVASVVAATFALVLLGGYFTYLNMPTLSVRVAAAQAGIDASYPNYHPDGYALAGPVAYADGRVSMNFKANGGNQAFTLNQSKSSWDSDAVLDNYVTPRAGTTYIPYTERGLTIYTYKNNAAWVNGGILYTVEGDAPLSSEQIRRIATSLL